MNEFIIFYIKYKYFFLNRSEHKYTIVATTQALTYFLESFNLVIFLILSGSLFQLLVVLGMKLVIPGSFSNILVSE